MERHVFSYAHFKGQMATLVSRHFTAIPPLEIKKAATLGHTIRFPKGLEFLNVLLRRFWGLSNDRVSATLGFKQIVTQCCELSNAKASWVQKSFNSFLKHSFYK